MALQELYRAEQLPVFQNRMFRSRKEAVACPKGDVRLVRDQQTGLIFNAAFQPELMQYDADYQNEQATSSIFRAHLAEISAIISKHFSGQTLIEVGCGKGYFLEHLQAQGFSITGFDPTYEGQSEKIVKAYFSPGIGLSADAIILRHVLEHIPDPLAFLKSILLANRGQGRIYIEVPCFDWIVRNRAWFDIFFEHVNYFRLSDFDRLFGKVIEAGHAFGGQYLYVLADLASLREPVLAEGDDFKFPEDFLATVSAYAENINKSRALGRKQVVVWGGASKGVIFSLFMQRAGVDIDYVIDINPAKQGKYLGATGYKVSAPDEVVPELASDADIFVMNGNYLPEIRQMTGNRFNYLTVDHGNI